MSRSIYTAGYGNRGFDGFIELMVRFGVTHIVDIRSVPQSSYWEDFRRENLIDSIPAKGFKYVYMGDTLGGVQNSPILCKEPGAVDINPLFEMPALKLGIETLLKAAENPKRTMCLMCGCKRPHSCHRSRLLGEALLAIGVDLQHIDADDRVVSHSQLDFKPQSTLF
jgi:uncharacterized protein (DUF488 family)